MCLDLIDILPVDSANILRLLEQGDQLIGSLHLMHLLLDHNRQTANNQQRGDILILMQIGTIHMRTRFGILQPSLIIRVEAVLALNGLVVLWMEEVLYEIGAHGGRVLIFNKYFTVDDLHLALRERVSALVQYRVKVAAVEVRRAEGRMVSAVAFTGFEVAKIHELHGQGYIINFMKYLQIKVILIVVLQMASIAALQEFTPEETKLITHIKEVLDSHLVQGEKWGMKFHFYRPGLEKYGPDQWLWDSAFHMISWSRLNVTNSILDLRTMLQKQVNKNARIPEMIFWGKQTSKDILLNKLLLSDTTQTDITQMPMLPLALKRIYEATNNSKAILQEFLVKIIEYHGWWSYYRQPDHDGLVVIIHPWESGLDASPMYDEALRVEHDQPKLKELYKQFIELEVSYKYIYRWNQNKIIRKKNHRAYKKFLDYFVVKEVGVNSVYTYGWKVLADLSHQLGNDQMRDYCLKEYRHFLAGLESLYDESKGRYTSRYLNGAKFQQTQKNTVQVLFPIMVPDIRPEHKESILNMLSSEKHYKSNYPIPTVSRSDPAYNPIFTIDLMWRGPSWAAPNYFILEGLRNGNHTDLFKEIGTKWVNEALKNGIWEMWNPETGQGYGVKQLGMSTSVIDILFKLKEMS